MCHMLGPKYKEKTSTSSVLQKIWLSEEDIQLSQRHNVVHLELQRSLQDTVQVGGRDMIHTGWGT